MTALEVDRGDVNYAAHHRLRDPALTDESMAHRLRLLQRMAQHSAARGAHTRTMTVSAEDYDLLWPEGT